MAEHVWSEAKPDGANRHIDRAFTVTEELNIPSQQSLEQPGVKLTRSETSSASAAGESNHTLQNMPPDQAEGELGSSATNTFFHRPCSQLITNLSNLKWLWIRVSCLLQCSWPRNYLWEDDWELSKLWETQCTSAFGQGGNAKGHQQQNNRIEWKYSVLKWIVQLNAYKVKSKMHQKENKTKTKTPIRAICHRKAERRESWLFGEIDKIDKTTKEQQKN